MSPQREVALVTGGASGIGRETSHALAGRGAAVVVLDRSADGCGAVAEDIQRAGGIAVGIVGDVTVPADVEAACRRAGEKFGQLTTVVSCAGVDVPGLIDSLDYDTWNRCIAVNLTGVFLVAKYSIPSLLASGRGAFVAVSSAAGLRGFAGMAAYSAAKHGVVGLVRTLALDYGPKGLRANAVCPGFIDTPPAETFFREAPPGEVERRLGRIPLGRFGQPSEVARLILHLTSEEATYTNGSVQVIDGASYVGFLPRPLP